jgi:GrpB-like predicted nucleotidyltransferase (UPF0157 family)
MPVRPYDPLWAASFVAERDRLLTMFPRAFLDIQHVGSTSVPGLSAKPVVDILAGVPTMAAADPLVLSLRRAKYRTSELLNDRLRGRRMLVRGLHARRTHHLHLVAFDGREWQRRLAFRDALREDRALFAAYDEMKCRLARRYGGNRDLYVQAKAEFVRSVLGSA